MIEGTPRHKLPGGEWRDDQRGHAETQPPVTPQRGVCGRNWSERGSHVVEETTPLVECDDQNGVGPRGAVRHSRVHLIEECFAVANIRVRMVVIGGAAGLVDESRVDIGNLGEQAALARGNKFGIRMSDAEVLRSPKCCERNVIEEVSAVESGRSQAIPDGRKRGQCEALIEPIRLRRVHVETIGKRRRERSGEIVIAGRPIGRGLTEKAEVLCLVIPDREQIIRRGPEPAVALAAVELDTAAGVGVVWIGERAILVNGQVIGGMGLA